MADTSKNTSFAASNQGEHQGKKTEPPSKTGAGDAGVVELVKEQAKAMAAAAGEVTGQATEKVQEWAATASEKGKDAAAAAGQFAAQAKDKVQAWTATAADAAGSALHDAGPEFTALVRRYPFPALLAGVAVGFLLGRVTTRS